jgi:hypothetical protein
MSTKPNLTRHLKVCKVKKANLEKELELEKQKVIELEKKLAISEALSKNPVPQFITKITILIYNLRLGIILLCLKTLKNTIAIVLKRYF